MTITSRESETREKTSFIEWQGDPLQVKHYKLSNGMSLYLSVNHNEPRVYTNIAFRAGSKYDPAEATGLAHYMEHMLFKGSSQIGTLNWAEEHQLLERIADLFEVYRKTTDSDERKALYTEIDKLSHEATRWVSPNEYDRLATALGSRDTNAYTGLEQTVYVNDIPANELERWFQLESERFRNLALRLFHTELETVYEEFNIGQDNDFRKSHHALLSLLFPKHRYGTETIIGRPEHLKNPSIRLIESFFNTYYVPNNMAIVLAGELDPEETVKLAERYFGSYKAKDFPKHTFDEQPVITAPLRKEVLGQESPYLIMGWRLGSGRSEEGLMASLVQHLLHNQQAGLIDLNINQEQKALEAEAFAWLMEDYSILGLFGKPRDGQTLEELEVLLLEQIQKLAAGEWDEWLLDACIKDMKLGDTKGHDSNDARVSAMTNCFVLGIPWEQYIQRFSWLQARTKDEVVAFVRERCPLQAYAVVYKQQGTDPGVIKVEKPSITPIELKREEFSEFGRQFLSKPPARMSPVFADFEKAIHKQTLKPGLDFHYVKNPTNDAFRLDYIFELGKLHSRELSLAVSYLPYLGTSKLTAADIQRSFFRLGLHFEVLIYDERCHVSLTGLEESVAAGIELVEHILADLQPDANTWSLVLEDILLKRANAKQDRSVILREALINYARYGSSSPFTYRLNHEELGALRPDRLVSELQQLLSYEHRIYYYGRQQPESVLQLIQKHHRTPSTLLVPPPCPRFEQQPTTQDEVLFVHFPLVQTDLLMVSRGTPHFNIEEHNLQDLYNEYFGYGLSSIVFQEIRESKGLAYSTYAYYSSPDRKERAHYLRAYAGTQPDKVADALPALRNIIEEMPVVPEAIEQARQSLIQRIESDRILPRRLYWEAQGSWDLGHTHDLLRNMYDTLQQLPPTGLTDFHQKYIQGRRYKLLVLGDENQVPLDFLNRTHGPVQKLTLEEIFGY